jgi:hypothetical protein
LIVPIPTLPLEFITILEELFVPRVIVAGFPAKVAVAELVDLNIF